MKKAIVNIGVWMMSIANSLYALFQAIYVAASITAGFMGSRVELNDLLLIYPIVGILLTIILIVCIVKWIPRFKNSLVIGNSTTGFVYISIIVGYLLLKSA
jgi:hypothetical protein